MQLINQRICALLIDFFLILLVKLIVHASWSWQRHPDSLALYCQFLICSRRLAGPTSWLCHMSLGQVLKRVFYQKNPQAGGSTGIWTQDSEVTSQQHWPLISVSHSLLTLPSHDVIPKVLVMLRRLELVVHDLRYDDHKVRTWSESLEGCW